MKIHISSPEHVSAINRLLRQQRVVLILDVRQVEKTTRVHDLLSERKGKTTFLDLEDPRALATQEETAGQVAQGVSL